MLGVKYVPAPSTVEDCEDLFKEGNMGLNSTSINSGWELTGPGKLLVYS
jgi:hypothetical protein